MNQDFLKKLQAEAKQQKKISQTRIIPSAFDPVTSYIGENTVVVLLVLSIFTAIVLEVLKRI